MKLITLVLIILVFISSCCNCTKFNLTETDAEWTKVYQTGELIKFKSDKNNIDSFKVTEIRNFYTNSKCNCFELSNIQKQVYDVSLKCINRYNSNGILMVITKEKQNKAVIPYLRVLNLTSKDKSMDSIDNVKLSTNNVVYKSIICTNHNYEIGIEEYLKSFAWNKRIGLIKYETIDGEIFKLWKE